MKNTIGVFREFLQEGNTIMAKDDMKSPFGDAIFNPFKDMKMPNFDMKDMMSGFEQNVELMNDMQKISMETAQALMQMHTQYMQNLMRECGELAKMNLAQGSLSDKKELQAKAMKDLSEEAVAHIKDLSSVLTKSNEKIMGGLKDKFTKK
jgi:phasin family protein